MKIFYFLLILSISNHNSYGQLEKGTWLVGGSGSFYSYTENYSRQSYSQTAKYTSIDIAGSVGYFIAEKFVLGLRPGYMSYKGEVMSASTGSGGKTNLYKLAVGPFARYYFLSSDKPFNILAEACYQIGINKFLGALPEKGKFNTLSFLVGPEIFINETAGFEILLGYTQKVVSIENSPGAFNNKKSGFQMSVGFTLHLNKL